MWKVPNLVYKGIKAMVLQPSFCQNWVRWAIPNIQCKAHSQSSDLAKIVLFLCCCCCYIKVRRKIRSYCRSVISGAVFSKAYLNSGDVKICKCMCHRMGEVCSLYLTAVSHAACLISQQIQTTTFLELLVCALQSRRHKHLFLVFVTICRDILLFCCTGKVIDA